MSQFAMSSMGEMESTLPLYINIYILKSATYRV